MYNLESTPPTPTMSSPTYTKLLRFNESEETENPTPPTPTMESPPQSTKLLRVQGGRIFYDKTNSDIQTPYNPKPTSSIGSMDYRESETPKSELQFRSQKRHSTTATRISLLSHVHRGLPFGTPSTPLHRHSLLNPRQTPLLSNYSHSQSKLHPPNYSRGLPFVPTYSMNTTAPIIAPTKTATAATTTTKISTTLPSTISTTSTTSTTTTTTATTSTTTQNYKPCEPRSGVIPANPPTTSHKVEKLPPTLEHQLLGLFLLRRNQDIYPAFLRTQLNFMLRKWPEEEIRKTLEAMEEANTIEKIDVFGSVYYRALETHNTSGIQ